MFIVQQFEQEKWSGLGYKKTVRENLLGLWTRGIGENSNFLVNGCTFSIDHHCVLILVPILERVIQALAQAFVI